MTRVLLRDLPTMLRDILSHALVREPDVELLEWMPEPPHTAARPDVVIGNQDAPDPHWVRGVLGVWPDCRVLLIASAGHQVTLFELHPHRTALGEMSLDELVSVVTRVARDPRLSFENLESTTSKGKPAMAEKPYNPDYGGGSGGASLTELVEVLKGIRTDLVATRVGAPPPDVQSAVNEANLLVGFLNESFAPAATPASVLPKEKAQLLGRIGQSTSV
jgi:hypothetical protein